MKRSLIILGVVLTSFTSCKKFLDQQNYGVVTTSNYYNTPAQIRAAVDGLYSGLAGYYATELAVAASPAFQLEYITGYTVRPRPAGNDEVQFIKLPVTNVNGALDTYWTATYYPVENCNSVIANIQNTSVIDTATRHKDLGEAYFLRASYYFNAVRLFGSIPLKTTPTTDINNVQIGKSSIDAIYAQIVSDLTNAEQSGLPWVDVTGHVNMAAVKSLLAKVYLTMAGYPLQKGATYYQMAYDKSKEVIDNGSYSLYSSYADLRNKTFENKGEQIFMIQRAYTPTSFNSILHFSLLPYPTQPISKLSDNGGAMAPDSGFYNTFANDDLRKQNQQFFYTSHTAFGKDSLINLPRPYIYKHWDDAGETSGTNGLNIPMIRYADVLLMCAEARTMIDGGTTSDKTALDSYYAVHHRAFANQTEPASITTEDVLKERFWELCYEFQTWYDMTRTRKALDVSTNKIVDLIGYKAPQHSRAFTEADLTLPIPFVEIQRDPKLAQ